MTDVDDVIHLLERWRDASGLQRVRVGVEAARTIGGLPAARKRTLAVEVAKRVAPQLVPAIESESGDLTGEQVSAVIDLLRRADRDQLDELVDALRSGDVLEALEIVDEAVTIIEPQLPPPAVPVTDADPADAAMPTVEATAAATAAAATVTAAPTTSTTADVVGPAPAAKPILVGHSVRRKPAPAVDEQAVRAELHAAALARAELWSDDSEATSHRPAYRAPAMDFGIDAELELPDTSVEELPPLHERLDALPGGAVGTTAVGASARAASPGPVPPAARVDIATGGAPSAVVRDVLAAADGYRRRRLAMAELRDGTLDAQDVLAIARSMAGPGDRVWLLGAALDTGLLDAEDLTQPAVATLLSVAATRRLARRGA